MNRKTFAMIIDFGFDFSVDSTKTLILKKLFRRINIVRKRAECSS